MEKLALSLDTEMEIMCKWEMTAEEWLFVRALFVAKYEQDTRPLTRYFNDCVKTGIPRETIKSLQKKKVLSKSFKVAAGVTLGVDDLEFEESFDKKYFKISGEGGAEMFNAYPEYINLSNGKLVGIKNITKQGFRTLEDFFFVYSKAIKHSKQKHDLVMKSLEFAKEHNLINYLITEYVITQKWESHIKMMESGEIGKFVTTFDTYSAA